MTQHHVSLITQYDDALTILSKATTVHLGLGMKGISPSVARVEQVSLTKEVKRKTETTATSDELKKVTGGIGIYSSICSKSARKSLFTCMEHQFQSLYRLILTLEQHQQQQQQLASKKEDIQFGTEALGHLGWSVEVATRKV